MAALAALAGGASFNLLTINNHDDHIRGPIFISAVSLPVALFVAFRVGYMGDVQFPTRFPIVFGYSFLSDTYPDVS